jgi:hypothetical protein
MRRARITAAGVQVDITLRETATADAIWAALPISGSANTWGDEVYFATPVSCERESGAKDVMQPGEIAFWPDGDAIAIGYGPTPISSGDEIRLASPSNVWADADSDVRAFASVRAGSAITVEAL